MTLTDEIFVKITAETQKAVSNIAGLAKSFAAAYLSVEAFKKVVVDSVKEYIQGQDAIAKYSNALKVTGQYSDYAVERISKLSSNLQGVTRFSDDATASAAAMLVQLGGMSAEMAERTIPLVQDFAAAMGLDLEQAATVVGKSLDGTTNMLGRYGIQIDTTLTGSKRLAAITDEMRSKFGGMAKAMGDTAGGSFVKLQHAAANLKEEFGRALMTNGPFPSFLAWLTDVVAKTAEGYQGLNNFRDAVVAVEAGTATTTQKITALSGELVIMKREADAAAAGLTRVSQSMAGPNAGFVLNYGGVQAVKAEQAKAPRGIYMNEQAATQQAIGFLQIQAGMEEAEVARKQKLIQVEKDAAAAEDGLRKAAIDRLSQVGQANATWNDVLLYRLQQIHDAMEGVDEITNATWADVAKSKSMGNALSGLVGSASTGSTVDISAMQEQSRELASQWTTIANAAVQFGEALIAGDPKAAIKGILDLMGQMLIAAGARLIAEGGIAMLIPGLALMALGGISILVGSAIGASGGSGGSSLPHYATGTDYVPKTGLAVVHQGESITPYGGGGRGGGNITIHVHGGMWQADDLARKVAGAMGSW